MLSLPLNFLYPIWIPGKNRNLPFNYATPLNNRRLPFHNCAGKGDKRLYVLCVPWAIFFTLIHYWILCRTEHTEQTEN